MSRWSTPGEGYAYETGYFEGRADAKRWILVTKRLPKPNEENGLGFLKAYLVQDGRWMDVARWDGKYWVAWGYGIVLNNVTAWMPLPDPWKGEEDG